MITFYVILRFFYYKERVKWMGLYLIVFLSQLSKMLYTHGLRSGVSRLSLINIIFLISREKSFKTNVFHL